MFIFVCVLNGLGVNCSTLNVVSEMAMKNDFISLTTLNANGIIIVI